MNWKKRENFMKIIRREGCGFVPCRVSINGKIWDENPQYFEKKEKKNN